MSKISFLDVLGAGFIFLRYIRANDNVLVFFLSLFFIVMALYESKYNLSIAIILSFTILIFSFAAYLKETKHSFIFKVQKGYKPTEIIIQNIIFLIIGVVVFWALYMRK